MQNTITHLKDDSMSPDNKKVNDFYEAIVGKKTMQIVTFFGMILADVVNLAVMAAFEKI